MKARPERSEAAPYYFRYIDLVPEGDVLARLEAQLDETMAFLGDISEEKSLHRYAPEKWSIRTVLSHVTDAERLFLFRAFWFGRGFDSSAHTLSAAVQSANSTFAASASSSPDASASRNARRLSFSRTCAARK